VVGLRPEVVLPHLESAYNPRAGSFVADCAPSCDKAERELHGYLDVACAFEYERNLAPRRNKATHPPVWSEEEV
jgi:hypothetical protein